MVKVLVIGGTGMLGRPVVVRLISDGFDVRVFTTNRKKAEAYFGDQVECTVGDIFDKQSLIKAMDSCDFVYINLKGGPTASEFIRIESDGSKNVYAAAFESGISKVVQISGANAIEKNARFPFIRGKIEAEKALVASGLTYTVLRPSWFCESLPLFVQGNKAVYIGSGKTSFHFLAAADYVRIVSECFQSDKADNKILTIFGPESMPIPEAMRRFLAIAYPDVTINHLPIWLAKWSTIISFNKKLKAAVRMMAFFNKHDDSQADPGPEEADRIFGRSSITVEEYAKMYRKIVKGV
jgi:divinyl chlorophyllide a 8-vinyl-reductase